MSDEPHGHYEVADSTPVSGFCEGRWHSTDWLWPAIHAKEPEWSADHYEHFSVTSSPDGCTVDVELVIAAGRGRHASHAGAHERVHVEWACDGESGVGTVERLDPACPATFDVVIEYVEEEHNCGGSCGF